MERALLVQSTFASRLLRPPPPAKAFAVVVLVACDVFDMGFVVGGARDVTVVVTTYVATTYGDFFVTAFIVVAVFVRSVVRAAMLTILVVLVVVEYSDPCITIEPIFFPL